MQPGNQILDALTESEALRLEPHLEPIRFEVRDRLFRQNQDPGFAYFPISAVISLLRGFENGAVIEVGIVGREGMAGIHSFLGDELEPTQAIVQCDGEGYRLRVPVLLEFFREGGELQALLLRFTHALFTQISQTAACNQLHLADQRLARWLLSMDDRIDDDVIPLTHEFLAHMLGASRARVSEALRRFRDGGAVECNRSQVTIRNRQRLEEWACECYQAVNEAYSGVPRAPVMAGSRSQRTERDS